MRTIGIVALGISINAVILVIVTSIFDVPFGALADRWSSHGLFVYTIGTAIYGLYLCLTNGTLQAITYDSLKEVGREHLYAKHQGGSYALFMAGIAVSSPLGGFLSRSFGYRSSYYLSAVICIFNLLIILSRREPVFHKASTHIKLRNHISATS